MGPFKARRGDWVALNGFRPRGPFAPLDPVFPAQIARGGRSRLLNTGCRAVVLKLPMMPGRRPWRHRPIFANHRFYRCRAWRTGAAPEAASDTDPSLSMGRPLPYAKATSVPPAMAHQNLVLFKRT